MRGAKKSVCVMMPQELYQQVREQAEKTCRTMPGYIRQVLKCYLQHVEHTSEDKEWEI